MTQTRALAPNALSILSDAHMPVAAHWAVKFAVLATAWATRRRTRLALAQLEPWQLADVGLTPSEADAESGRVFWQP
ncbi:hypothetical protein Z945_1920 [Sulfitobacter noctilucae]|uniref:DUF1127 domain-containing protein n=1 Tax=Sulfitobacter noctilucae TaxID=1342302 RepID=UPI00046A91E8|nr:DUF1127 domain-containing protein [Sulfitobacter noctilucae]KIN60937.1 hypothetical protein Z945_1920 [Sulfitobacter noctilucae]